MQKLSRKERGLGAIFSAGSVAASLFSGASKIVDWQSSRQASNLLPFVQNNSKILDSVVHEQALLDEKISNLHNTLTNILAKIQAKAVSFTTLTHTETSLKQSFYNLLHEVHRELDLFESLFSLDTLQKSKFLTPSELKIVSDHVRDVFGLQIDTSYESIKFSVSITKFQN